jgi:hypothetical protein
MSLIKPAPDAWRNPLKRGIPKGHDIAAWQSVLRLEKVPDNWTLAWPLTVDGYFGPVTEKVTGVFQDRRGLTADGIVGPATRAAIDPTLFAAPSYVPDVGLPPIAFVQAKYYQHAERTVIDNIVMHAAEDGEYFNSAEAIGQYFHLGPPKPASAHYGVDVDSIVQYVRDEDIAFHAPPNARSLGIEQAGYSKQTRAEWLDDYGQKMLQLVGRLVRAKADQWNIPLVWLGPDDLKRGARGLCTHYDVTLAFHETDHTDPGPDYPKDILLQIAQEAA